MGREIIRNSTVLRLLRPNESSFGLRFVGLGLDFERAFQGLSRGSGSRSTRQEILDRPLDSFFPPSSAHRARRERADVFRALSPTARFVEHFVHRASAR